MTQKTGSKKKGNFVLAPPKQEEHSSTEEESEEIDDVSENDYDSMIENGTSESEDEEETEEEDNDNADDDDEDEDEVQTNNARTGKRKIGTSEQPQKKKKLNDVDAALYKPPTVEEINELKETENLFHSNLFRLQIDELVNEIKMKEKHQKQIEDFGEQLKEFLKANLKSEEYRRPITETPIIKKNKIKLPINLNGIDIDSSKLLFQFIAPEKVYFIGSYRQGTLFGDHYSIDICLEIPSKCFQKDNSVNLGYHYKRALYACYIAKTLKNWDKVSSVKFTYFRNDPYKPIVELLPIGKFGSKASFALHIVGEQDSFKLNRFVPWGTNIRPSLFSKRKVNPNDPLYATPHYNAGVLMDITTEANNTFLETEINGNVNLQNSIKLIKIWLKQRQLDKDLIGFNGHLAAMYLVHLVKTKKVNLKMSSYQILRLFWHNLANSNWNEEGKGISLCTTHSGDKNQPTLDQMSQYYEVVMIDSTGFLNLCSNLSIDVYNRLKDHCSRAIELLDNKQINSFQCLFMMTEYPIYMQCDQILRISGQAIRSKISKIRSRGDDFDYLNNFYPLSLKRIGDILRKGLGCRIKSIVPIRESCGVWEINEEPRYVNQSLKIGFKLDQAECIEILDKGPEMNNEETEKFRSFWGDQSQLRRFQDGSITESCVWMKQTASLQEKRMICAKVAQFLLKHHFKINEADISYIGAELNPMLHLKNNGTEIDIEARSLEIIKVFDEVAKCLRSLNDLPLSIVSVQGISPVFRYCDIDLPSNHATLFINEDDKKIIKSDNTIQGVIQLAMSGNWPDTIEAFRRIKAAFHIQIAKGIENAFKLKTRGTVDGIDILKSGIHFNFIISHPKELGLLKKEVTDKGILQYRDTPESIKMEQQTVVLPKLTSALHALYQENTSYGLATQMAKMWFNYHLIDDYLFPNLCIELLMAYQYYNMGAIENPTQPQVGFFRFLRLLSITAWQTDLFILNFNDEIAADDLADIESKFSIERQSYPSLCILTSYDYKFGGLWSKDTPSPEILNRVSLIAKYSCKLIENNILSKTLLDYQILISTLNVGYNAFIVLNSDVSPDQRKKDKTVYSERSNNLQLANLNSIDKYLDELRVAYGKYAVFFCNKVNPTCIAVIWKPNIFDSVEFKAGNTLGRRLEENTLRLKCSIDQLAEDFKIVGKGLVKHIKVINPI